MCGSILTQEKLLLRCVGLSTYVQTGQKRTLRQGLRWGRWAQFSGHRKGSTVSVRFCEGGGIEPNILYTPVNN